MEGSKILMVDDEPDVAPMVRSRMRRDIRAGRVDFIFASDGVEAVEILSEDKSIDIVVTDINMPRMDGLALLGGDPSASIPIPAPSSSPPTGICRT